MKLMLMYMIFLMDWQFMIKFFNNYYKKVFEGIEYIKNYKNSKY